MYLLEQNSSKNKQTNFEALLKYAKSKNALFVNAEYLFILNENFDVITFYKLHNFKSLINSAFSFFILVKQFLLKLVYALEDS